jgi:hypothetical protein
VHEENRVLYDSLLTLAMDRLGGIAMPDSSEFFSPGSALANSSD